MDPSYVRDLMDLGGWRVSMFLLSVFIFSVFKADPWLSSRGRCNDIKEDRDAETKRANAAEAKYVDLLKENLQDMKDRDRTLEVLSKAAERREGT